MSDSDDMDIDGEDIPDTGASKKKRTSALGAILPTILKFAAIGIGALIFIVTVSVITYNIMNKGGKSQTVVTDPSSPYIGKRPIYATYTEIGAITTKLRDEKSHTITVVMNLQYDQDDGTAFGELNGRKHELQDFVRRYFAGKYASEVKENEERIKRDIQEILNQRFLDTGKVRGVLFSRLDITETY
ncbi:MAG: flagellar basal body-associated FliL family protein [Treponema sp.]|nr:flagellar basal body-associated FliL family protein [Treponema sp.]